MHAFTNAIQSSRAALKSTRVDSHRNNHVTSVTYGEVPDPNAKRQDFIDAMSAAVTGVNLITTDGLAGKCGITVSAMSSVSADPPMLLACINRRSPACVAIQSNQVFCVNVLSTRQQCLANVFAGSEERGKSYDFSLARWEPGYLNVPRLIDATSSFDCALEYSRDTGSHTIFIGRVTVSTGNAFGPLLYTNRSYGFPCRSE
jgi:flavin reductase (DIM6/NTAB) family NADH-FMN oxidoreductase RutF